MKVPNIRAFSQKVMTAINRNSPTILTSISVAGLVTTAVLTGKGAIKASKILHEKRIEPDWRDFPNGPKEVIKLTWKCYIPAVAVGSTTIACIIGANSINLRRNAALASVYSLTETAFKEYQAKVVETIGEKKAQAIKDEIAQDKLNENPLSKNQIIFTGKGDVLCYEDWSGRYFYSDMETLRKLQNDINKRLISEMWISLNDAYCEMGLAPIKGGNDVGWDVDNMVAFDFSAKLAEGKPCIVVGYESDPSVQFRY